MEVNMELSCKNISKRPISNLYEGTIERLTVKGYFSPETEDHILSEIKKLNKLKIQVLSIPEARRHYFCDQLLVELKNGACPLVPMALSMIYFNLTAMGVDTRQLKDFLDTDYELQKEIEETINAD